MEEGEEGGKQGEVGERSGGPAIDGLSKLTKTLIKQ